MKTKLTFLIGYCDEELEKRIEKLREAGLGEEEIDLLLNVNKLPQEVRESLKKGDKVFTQDQVTKARNDERRKIEGNLKYKRKPVEDVDTDDDEGDDDSGVPPVRTSSKKRKADPTPTIDPESIKDMIAEAVKQATEPLLKTNEKLKEELNQVAETVKSDKQKAFEKRKAAILAELPEETHALLVGDTIEALETSYASIKAFVDKTKQELKSSQTAEEELKKTEKSVFFKASDGTTFNSAAEIVAKGGDYLKEFKSQDKFK